MSFGSGFGSSTPAANTTFGFGTATPGVATPIRPVQFGTSGTGFGFSAPAASNTPSLFGVPTTATTQSIFGTPSVTTTQPLFGTPATTTQSLFGTPASTTQSLFGTPATQQTTAFGTGTGFSTPAATGFGATAATTTSTFSTPSNNFGFGTNTGFGAIPASSMSTFGLGSTAPVTSLGNSSFGSFGGFGTSTSTTSSAPLFGGFGTTNPQQQTSVFGGSFSAFGAKPVTTNTTGFGGFNTGNTFANFGSTLSQPQQLQQQQIQPNTNTISEALYNAVFNCQLFNDERDNTIARWNLIQALWGVGKAYYCPNAPPIELNQENPLCRFKAIGYSRMPDADNNDGLVALCFSKKEQELKDQKQQLIASINQVLGNKPNLSVTVDNIKSIGESKGQVSIYVVEKGATGSLRKIPAIELFNFLTQPIQKQQLTQMGVENVFPQIKLDPAQLKEYLENPPCSIDPRLWKQAQLDNPDPEHYIPVPMIGFQQVKHRLKCREEETARHRAFLDLVTEDIQHLQRQQTGTQARLKEHRRTLLELQHRVLQVLVRQEITRKIGFSLQPEEEILTNKFEAMHSQISAPTQFKGRISEMLSQLRMRRHVDTQNQERYTMDPIAQDDIKIYLNMEQQGMTQLIETVNADLESLRIIKEGMSDLVSNQNIT
ncbi:nuclear pore complex protein Nup54-like [Phymastichus coffea]|uniref:nuclear pore complex protein Nup54-like n=1 Tax=Phymastichus coffea TaxID=108790 RepID=UPI00273A9401|nr:nuclear pore complex protein Nup54-like [Phymastichus coffea]